MAENLTVLGIDLASKQWSDNGAAFITFTSGEQPAWTGVEYGCIDWPRSELTPASMAEAIERVVRDRRISAVSLDGPQGWREPEAGDRPGVGRVCEYKAHTQGKTGEFGRTFPQGQHGWIAFCIQVFARLIDGKQAVLANSTGPFDVTSLGPGQYFLLECFPTNSWRASKLLPLPGKSRIGRKSDIIAAYARSLQQRYELPGYEGWKGSHDDLQAIVAALPAVGLLGGPCGASAVGSPARQVPATEDRPSHWVEGLIWDALPTDEQLTRPVELPKITAATKSSPEAVSASPFLVEERDDEVAERLVERGLNLYRGLTKLANSGHPVGVSYKQLVPYVHGFKSHEDFMGRPFAPPDIQGVIQLAHQITDANGGPIAVLRDGVKIEAGMDAFVWKSKRPHDRHRRAFERQSYTKDQWRTVFPDGHRRLLRDDDCVGD